MGSRYAAYTVVVTRPAGQAQGLMTLLEERGFCAVCCPAIKIDEIAPDEGCKNALGAALRGEFDWVVFSSANGVRSLFRLQEALFPQVSLPQDLRIAAQGPITAKVFQEQCGRFPDLVPQSYVSEGFLHELQAEDLGGKRVLLVQAAASRNVLAAGLRKAGAHVQVLALYRTVPVEIEKERLEELARDQSRQPVFVFFSPSSFQSIAAYDHLLEGAKIAVIGPVTAAAVRERGYEVLVEAADQSDAGVVAALEEGLR